MLLLAEEYMQQHRGAAAFRRRLSNRLPRVSLGMVVSWSYIRQVTSPCLSTYKEVIFAKGEAAVDTFTEELRTPLPPRGTSPAPP